MSGEKSAQQAESPDMDVVKPLVPTASKEQLLDHAVAAWMSPTGGGVESESRFEKALEYEKMKGQELQNNPVKKNKMKLDALLQRKYIHRTKGEEISQEHEQFALTYSMMIGIRHVVATMQDFTKSPQQKNNRKRKRRTLADVPINHMEDDVEPRHFAEKTKFVFPPNGRSKALLPQDRTPPHRLTETFKFKDYSPEIFQRLRRRFGIDDLDYMLSLCGSFNFIEFVSNSKSGEFFFYSHDGLYLIKTQSRVEARTMRKMLPAYYEYVAKQKNTLMTRICGAHRVKLPHLRRRTHFVIMSSVFADAQVARPIHRVYDVKGATKGRKAKPGEKVGKDNDALASNLKLKLGGLRNDFLMQLSHDAAFLQSQNVMDYSVLLGIAYSDDVVTERMSSLDMESDPANTPKADRSGAGVMFKSNRRVSVLQATDSSPSMFTHSSQSSFTPSKKVATPIPEKKRQGRSGSLGADETAMKLAEQARLQKQANRAKSSEYFHTSEKNLRLAALEEVDGVDKYNHMVTEDGTETYYVGIIDIFTPWNVKKIGEHRFKSLYTNGSKISAVNPKRYAKRFVQFVAGLVSDK